MVTRPCRHGKVARGGTTPHGVWTSPDQFKIIDPLTVQVTLPNPDKLALPNLATVYPIIINSKVAKRTPPLKIRGRRRG